MYNNHNQKDTRDRNKRWGAHLDGADAVHPDLPMHAAGNVLEVPLGLALTSADGSGEAQGQLGRLGAHALCQVACT